jgi:hypothetical protein
VTTTPDLEPSHKTKRPHSTARFTLWTSAIAAGVALCLVLGGFVAVIGRVNHLISRVNDQIMISSCTAHSLDAIIAGLKADAAATLQGKAPPPFVFPRACT